MILFKGLAKTNDGRDFYPVTNNQGVVSTGCVVNLEVKSSTLVKRALKTAIVLENLGITKEAIVAAKDGDEFDDDNADIVTVSCDPYELDGRMVSSITVFVSSKTTLASVLKAKFKVVTP